MKNCVMVKWPPHESPPMSRSPSVEHCVRSGRRPEMSSGGFRRCADASDSASSARETTKPYSARQYRGMLGVETPRQASPKSGSETRRPSVATNSTRVASANDFGAASRADCSEARRVEQDFAPKQYFGIASGRKDAQIARFAREYGCPEIGRRG